jgi:hypothetical protein
MNSILRQDRFITGVIIGIILPAVVYFLFVLSMEASGKVVTSTISEKMQLFIIAVNAVVMRQFMVKREQDNIGRGILLVTMLGAVFHFVYYYTNWIRP